MLATEGVPPHLHFVQYEFEQAAEAPTTHRQVWFSEDVSSWIWIGTTLDSLPTTPPASRKPLDTSAWTTEWSEAFLVPTAGGVTALALQDDARVGWVDVRGFRVDETLLTEIAGTLQPIDVADRGWTSPVLDDFVFFGADEGGRASYRSLLWSNGDNRPQAELRVSTNAADDFALAWQLGLTAEQVEIGGRSAILVESGSRWYAHWRTDNGVSVTAGVRGTREDAMQFFESVRPFDGDELDSLVQPIPDSMSRGCQSMWC